MNINIERKAIAHSLSFTAKIKATKLIIIPQTTHANGSGLKNCIGIFELIQHLHFLTSYKNTIKKHRS